MIAALHPVLVAVAAAGLPSAPTLPRQGWSERLDAVLDQGLAGLLASAAAAGRVDIDEPTAMRLRNRLEAEAIRAVHLEGELLRLDSLLDELRAVVLKGAVLAHGAYVDPLVRPFTDLDLLVTDQRFDDAVAALSELGYQRTRPEPAPGYDSRVGKALTLSHPGGLVIDLHRTLAAGRPGAAVDVEEIVDGRILVPVGDQVVRAPSWEAHLVECALHAVVGDGLARGLSIRDVAEVAQHPSLDAAAVVEMSRRWRVSEQVSAALQCAELELGATLPAPLTALSWESGGTVPAIAAAVRSARSRLDDLVHGDLRRRVILTRALLAPSPAFLRWTYGTLPLPQLYARRWRTLYQRTLAAGPAAPDASALVVDGAETRAEPTIGPLLPSEATVDSKAAPTPASSAAGGAVGPRDAAALDPAPPREPTARPADGPADAPPPAPPAPTLDPPGRGASPRSGPRSIVAGARDRRAAGGGRQARWTAARPPRNDTPKRTPRSRGASPPGLESRGGAPPPPPGHRRGSAAPSDGPDPTTPGLPSAPPPPAGVPFGLAGGALLVTTALATQLGADNLGVVSVPLAAMLLAVAASRRIGRLRPDEAWVGRWLVWAVLAKLTASYLRYLTLVVGYEGVGDATGYDGFGRQFAAAWLGGGAAPELPDLRRTNFLRWFTGVVYYLFGSNMVAGFFVFGLLALVGSYLWYRAACTAVPQLNKKLFLGLMLFVPSIAFWPSSIGKESLMQLGIGTVALGTAHLLRQRLLTGLAVGLAGGWLLWVVRPHLLALVTVAAGLAYAVGRVRNREGSPSLLGRPVGLLVVVLLMAFTISQGAQFLGIDDLSLSSIEAELDEQTERSAQGGSEFDNGGNSLSPLRLPEGAITVLLRPFPWETDSPFQLLSSLESMVLAALILARFSSVRASLARARATPFLLYCWVLTVLYAATFSSFANFGLLVRQRSLVLPALFVLLAIDLARDRRPDPPIPARPLVGASRTSG